MTKLSDIPKIPARSNELRRWIQGFELDKWADECQDKLMSDTAKALKINTLALQSIERDQENLIALKEQQILPDDDLNAEELRLALLREKAVGTLEKLASIHQKITGLSQAVILAALVKPGTVSGPPDSEEQLSNPVRDANPRRSLAEVRRSKAVVVDITE